MLKRESPLTERERALLISKLKEYQPDAGQAEVEALLRFAENARVAGGLLDTFESGEVKFRVDENGKVRYEKRVS